MEEHTMRNIALTIITIMLVLTLFGCASTEEGLTGNEDITMENIDEYLDAEARFVDLRDFSDMLNGGYIEGFEVVPFFQYLEGRALERNNGWEFSEADIVDAQILENIFGDKNEPVVLMCGSGTRAGYTKAALEQLGYEKVYNAGGIRDYEGENKVLGDGEYQGAQALPEEVNMSNIDNYLDRPNAKYVDLRNAEDKYTSGYIDGFEVVSFFQYLEGNALKRNNGWEFSEEDIVSTAVLENIFGAKDREIFLMCGSGTRSGYTKQALEALGYEEVYNVGGIRDYQGDNKVLGDEDFSLTI
jgi:rhodanese-related sulfurtransferase